MNIQPQVIQIINRVILESTGREVDVAADDRLIETGILDSLSMVNLVMELQRQFDIDLDINDLNEQAFGSAGSIAALVTERGAT